MIKTHKSSFTRLISMGLSTAILLVGAGQALAAKGSGGGRTFEVALAQGSCILANNAVDPLASTSMIIRSAQGINYFIMQTIGANSVGNWDISFTKDGGLASKGNFDFPPPGGWAVTGGQVDKGAKSVIAVGVARNTKNGTVCTARIEKLF